MPSSFLADAVLIRHDGREGSQRKHDRRHAIIPLWAALHEAGAKKRACIILLCRLRISFSDVSISIGRRTAGAGSATGGPDANIRSWILLGSLAARGSVTSHKRKLGHQQTPTMMRRLSGPRQDIRDVLTCDNGRLHCCPVARYNPLLNIGTTGPELSTIPVRPGCSPGNILVLHPQDRASNCT